MALSQELITQFAKLVDNVDEKDKGETIRGTYQKIGNIEYVRLDGSDILTPVNSTVEAENGERVQVLIKDHFATITGNISSPAARSKSVQDLADTVDEYGNTIQQMDNTIIQQGNSIVQMNNTINQHDTTINQHDTLINQQGDKIVSIDNTVIAQGNSIEANHNSIIAQGNQIDSMNNTITEHGNNITSINNTVSAQGNQISQQANIIQQQGNTITQQGNTINEQGSSINILNSAFVIKDGVLTGLSGAIVQNLETTYLNSQYADINFANINMAAVEKLFTDSGIIKDLIVSQGKITGELVGVTIKGDLIEANSLKADKLVVRGEDGLYYKLNIDGLNNISTTEASKFILLSEIPEDWDENYSNYYLISNNKYQHVTGDAAPTFQTNTYYKLNPTYETALDGSNIVAHSIVAEKIAVDDLVAFGATIGGFVIGNASIHTVSKDSINSDLNGLYLGADGQLYIGSADNHIKYYKDTNNNWKLDIRASEIKMGASTKTIQEEINEVKEEVTTFLQIESSNGLCFKNSEVSTTLSVAVYAGTDRITNINNLRAKFGNAVYLQWKWKRINDTDYGIISSADSRISENGFKFTLTPQDVDVKVTFLCELVNGDSSPNLLLNSSFEKGLVNWSLTKNTMELLDDGGYNNGKACKINITETGTITPRQNVNYTLSAGDTITFSAKIKAISGDPDQLVARFANLLTLPKIRKTELSDGWSLYVYQASVSSTTNLNTHDFGLYQTSGVFIIDELKLELGTEATEWCPSIND